jgi:hypothetical protein
LAAFFEASPVASVARERDALADDAAFETAANVGRFFEVCAAIVDTAGAPSIRNRTTRAKRRPADEFLQLFPRVERAIRESMGRGAALHARYDELFRAVGGLRGLPERLDEREQQAFDAGAAREKTAK